MKRLQTKNLSQKGQALVEFAFIVPVLAFMLIGMIEVGWALRGYLTLANINREVTRRAVKADFLDFSNRTGKWTDDTESTHYYSNVLDPYFGFGGANFANNFPLPKLLEAFKNPENLTDDPAAYLTLTYFVVNTGAPCKRKDDGTLINCSCKEFQDAFDNIEKNKNFDQAKDAYYDIDSNFFYDDILIRPGEGLNFRYFFYTYPPDESKLENYKRYTRLPDEFGGSYENFLYYKALENAAFNCDLLARNPGLEPSNNNILYGELYYRQPQLLGFPIYSAIGGVPMYTQTSFRLMASVRNRIDPKTTGPLCAPLPFFGDRDTVKRVLRQAVKDGAYVTEKDRIRGAAINNYAPINLLANKPIVWLDWGSGNSVEFVKYRIQYPQMAFNERLKKGRDPIEPKAGLSGIASSTRQNYESHLAELQSLLESYAGQEVIVPANGFKGTPIVIIQPGGVDLANNQVMARVVGLAKSECFDSMRTNSGW